MKKFIFRGFWKMVEEEVSGICLLTLTTIPLAESDKSGLY